MATTPRTILQGAFSKSARTRAELIDQPTEGLIFVTRAVRGLFAYAAAVNPAMFATIADVTPVAGVWARDPFWESVFLVETLAGARVEIVPADDRLLAAGMPAIYEWGQGYRVADAAAGPVSTGHLNFYAAVRPADPATVDTAIDARWIDAFNELLVLETAVWIAVKDGRQDDVATLTALRADWLTLFDQFLAHATVGTLRRHYARQDRLQLARKLLAGGDA